MPPLVLSSMLQYPQALALGEFQTRSRLPVQHRYIPWASALSDVLNFALRSEGPDVSQVGSTWLGSLTGMDSLRLFRPDEVNLLGGRDVFIASAWESSRLQDVEEVYAIPWISDVRFVAYRRDIFTRAGIDEAQAFLNAGAFEDTLARLKAAGVENILALSTIDHLIYHLSPWVWGAGGDFRTPNYRHLTLTDPQTLAGIEQFYRLHRYLAPASRHMNMRKCVALFCQGGAAVMLAPYNPFWENMQKLGPGISPEMISLAPVPGRPFIGGSALAIWLHSYQEEAALKLIQHLVSPAVQWRLFHDAGELPVLAEVYTAEPFTTDRFLQVIAYSLKIGRPFYSSRKWAVIETHLNPGLSGLFADLDEDPGLDLHTEVPRRFAILQRSIEQSLLRTHPLI